MPARQRRAERSDAGPWVKWTRLSRPAKVIRFITRYCVVPRGVGAGELMTLHRFQREMLEELFAERVRVAVTSMPRGQGKSTLGAAVAVAELFLGIETGQPQIPILAATVGQAIRSVYGVAADMIRSSPELRRRVRIYTGIATPRVVVEQSNGELFPVAADPAGLQGLNPSFAIVDEVGFIGIDTWQSVLLATGKRPRSLVWGMGTPGLDSHNALYAIREQVLQAGRSSNGMAYIEFSAPPSCSIYDRDAWRIANPALKAGFLQLSALEQALELSPEAHFRVFRLGQFDVQGVESWLGERGLELWRSLRDPYELVPAAPSWVGVDVGIKRDSTAVVIVQRRDDGRLHARLRLWLPTADEPVDVTDVMAHLRELSRTYQLVSIAFDPRFFDVPAKMLLDEGLPVEEVPQSAEQMTRAVGSLYERVKRGQLSHDGDAVFEHQVLNAVARIHERGFTLSKQKSRSRIDAVIALALAVDRAEHEPAQPVFAATWR